MNSRTKFRIKTMVPLINNPLVFAATLGFVSAFAAADASPPLDAAAAHKLINHDDLTINGITLYGTIDAGFAYQTHGTPMNQNFADGLEYLLQKNSNKSISSAAPNGMSQSKLGIKGDIKVSSDLSVVFKLETAFNPLTGTLADSPKSSVNNNGVALNAQTSYGDSSRAGQLFQGAAYAGINSPTWGMWTFGRHNGLVTDGINKYDPQGGSYAFSVIGYSGVTAGAGDTQDARLDSTLRFSKAFGPIRTAALYQFGDGTDGRALELDVGGDYAGLAVDAFYSHKKQAVSVAPLSAAQVAVEPTGSLAATISDNTAWTLMASYSFNPVKIYAGYENIQYTNPEYPVAAGTTGLGGYVLSVVTNNAFDVNKQLQVAWTGAKYAATPDLDITGAFYYYYQSSYAATACDNTSSSKCAGTLHAYSLTADYKISKRFDIYAGMMFSQAAGGLAAGYLNTNTNDPMIGFRYNF